MTDINKRVEQYVRLRDHIKKMDEDHKAKMAPFRETLEQIGSVMLQHMSDQGAASIRTEAGTVYRTEKKTASCADKSAFWSFVVINGLFQEMLDWKPNVTAVNDYVEQNGELPPGVNFTVTNTVGVRRA